MTLGFAKKEITPEMPVPMAGYLVNRISKGVHDKLYVRSLYFKGALGLTVILQIDLLCIDKICLEKIYHGLKEKISPDLDKSRILVCTTHTHSGFGGIVNTEDGINRELIPLYGEYNPTLVNLVAERSIEAAAEAKENCTETTIRINHGKIEGLGSNRRKADLACDTSLFVIEFLRLDKKSVLLYNLSCHPTVMNGENLYLSADFPGSVAEKLEDKPGGYDMVVFINGSGGDMSTRFTRKESSFNECNRFAEMVVEALNPLRTGIFLPLEKVELQYHSISLKRAKTPDPENARANLQKAVKNLEELKKQNADTSTLRKAASLVEGAQMSLLKSGYAENSGMPPGGQSDSSIPEEKTVETGILKINTNVIVCSPFELFSSLALILKKKKKVDCFGYCNCLEGYLADCDAWDNLDYEALSGDFERGEGEHYIELISSIV